MEKYFLSEENINNQTRLLIKYIDFDKREINRDLVLKCKKIISGMMVQVFDRYASKKPYNMSTRDFIDKMNQKSIANCIDIIISRKQSKLPISKNYNRNNKQKEYSPNIYANPNELMNKMYNRQPENNTQQNEYMTPESSGGYASFSNNAQLNGPFITATGDVGVPLEVQYGNQYSQNGFGGNLDKKNFQHELETKLNALRNNYAEGHNKPPEVDPLTAQLLGLNRQNNQQQQQQVQQQPKQQVQQNYDFSSFMGSDDIGSNFNQVFTANSTNGKAINNGTDTDDYNGVDSFNNNFNGIQEVNVNDPKFTMAVKDRLQALEKERNSQNTVIASNKPKGKFNPMQSPNIDSPPQNGKEFFF